VSLSSEDEGSFAAGRQALLEALQSLEQRAHDRAERMVRDAERTARQVTHDSEQRAYQVTGEADERARQMLNDAELRAKQVTLEAAQRLADLEQQLTEVRDNLEAARVQLEEQVVAVRGQVEVARATLNTVRERLNTGGGRVMESRPSPTAPPPSRLTIPPLSSEEPVPGPTLNDLRAAVDALKKPRRGEQVAEAPGEHDGAEGLPDDQPNSAHR
jgi:uncharacterized coiled-coil protein SlyX